MMTLHEAARAVQSEWTGSDVLFTSVSTDTRTLQPGSLFIALSGEHFDGARFVAGAIDRGAVAAMINAQASVQNVPAHLPVIRVKDTRLALGQLAAYWRNRFALPLIAVTGSNGKTTVKEMIAAILRQVDVTRHEQEGEVYDHLLVTEGNLNNDIGVPQMLLRLRAHHRYAVIEMGMNHVGEIAYLTDLAKPDVAVITNAGAAHIEGLGSVDAVARAKAEIFQGLSVHGTAVINADDAHATLWRRCAGAREILDFGLREHARVSADYESLPLASRVTMRLSEGEVDVMLQVSGVHNIYNALAAAAATTALGIGTACIAAGLAHFQGVPGRLQKKSGVHQALLIDDTYNANPDSVKAALAVLAATSGKKILVLGDMGELGASSVELHRTIGRDARQAGLDRLLTLGELSAYATQEFGPGGQHFDSLDDLLDATESMLDRDVTLLVKGSRFMHMERVVRQLENKPS